MIPDRTRCTGRPLRAHIIALILVLLGVSRGLGHDLVDIERAVKYLEQIRDQKQALAPRNSVDQRAEAHFKVGEAVAYIVAYLNRDLMSHQGEPGLANTVMVQELKSQGIQLTFWPEAMRYMSYVQPFIQYLALTPEGPRRPEAVFRIFQGRFYDSFIYDPMQPVNLNWPNLVFQIKQVEDFLARYPDFRNREEAHFILVVNHIRAAHRALDADSKILRANQAQMVGQGFLTAYPDSLRAAAVRRLLERLPSID